MSRLAAFKQRSLVSPSPSTEGQEHFSHRLKAIPTHYSPSTAQQLRSSTAVCTPPTRTPPKGAFLPLPTSPTSAPTVTTPAGSNTTCSPRVAGLHIIMRQVLSSPVGKAAVEVRLSHIQPPQRGSRNKIPRKRFSRASSDV